MYDCKNTYCILQYPNAALYYKTKWTSPLNPVGGTISFVSLTKKKATVCHAGLKVRVSFQSQTTAGDFTDKNAENQTGGSDQ